MTAFVALLTIDANRQKAGKIDCYCCLTSERYLQEQERQHQVGVRERMEMNVKARFRRWVGESRSHPISGVLCIMAHRVF